MEIADKTALPNSIFKFNSRFLVPLNDFICESESANVFEHLWLNILHYLREKQSARLNVGNVLNTFLCCKQDSWKTLLEEL